MGPCAPVGSARARYLVFFQYLGTNFNGVVAVRGNQRAVGVLNFLEEAAEGLKSVEPVRFTVSSRTDAGVHALSNAAHLDIQRLPGLPPFSPEVVTQSLNTHLKHPAIRVLKAFRVPSDFHARHAATSRTYLYRLATGCAWPDQLPVFEQNVCWGLQTDCLNETAMQEAAQHLLGTHDFSAFQSAGSPTTSSMRTLHRVCLSPGLPSPFVLPQDSRRLRFWTLEFESQSFLYRQVLPPAPYRVTVWKPDDCTLSRCEEPEHTKSVNLVLHFLCSAETKPHPVLPSFLLPLALISPILPPWTLPSL